MQRMQKLAPLARQLVAPRAAAVALQQVPTAAGYASAAVNETLVATVAGEDKMGIITRLYHEVSVAGGHVDESRICRLGGEFSGIILVSGVSDSGLKAALRNIGIESSIKTAPVVESSRPVLRKVSMQVATSEVVKEVTDYLCSQGVVVDGMGQFSQGNQVLMEGVLKLPSGGKFSEKAMISGLSSRGVSINMLDL